MRIFYLFFKTFGYYHNVKQKFLIKLPFLTAARPNMFSVLPMIIIFRQHLPYGKNQISTTYNLDLTD